MSPRYAPGQRVDDRFEILERTASAAGGGSVYRARDLETGRDVALKVPARALEPQTVDRLAREAVVLAEIGHPAIAVPPSSAPRHGGYVVQEWLVGHTLADRLVTGPLPVLDALLVVARAADALGGAHQRGIVHRHIKPSNLFLVDRWPDQVKVIDFSLARRAIEVLQLERTGLASGTAGYLAPEQVRGQPADASADVFALGCVLREAITGRPAFEGTSMLGLQAKIVFHEPPDLRDRVDGVPAALADLVSSMLDKQAQHRPRDGAAVAAAISALLGDVSAVAAAERPLAGDLAAAAGPGPFAAVVLAEPPPEPSPPRRAVTAIARAHAGPIEMFDDGSLVVASWGDGEPTDHAVRCAEVALELRRWLAAGTRILVTSGRGAPAESAREQVCELVERGATALELASLSPRSAAEVIVDEPTRALLGSRFELEPGPRRLMFLRRRL